MSQNLQNFVKFQKIQLDNLVDVEKCCKTHIYLQKSVPIQPKTSNILPAVARPAAPRPPRRTADREECTQMQSAKESTLSWVASSAVIRTDQSRSSSRTVTEATEATISQNVAISAGSVDLGFAIHKNIHPWSNIDQTLLVSSLRC